HFRTLGTCESAALAGAPRRQRHRVRAALPLVYFGVFGEQIRKAQEMAVGQGTAAVAPGLDHLLADFQTLRNLAAAQELFRPLEDIQVIWCCSGCLCAHEREL